MQTDVNVACVLLERQNCYDHDEVCDTTALAWMRTELMNRVTTNLHVTYAKFDLIGQKSTLLLHVVDPNQVGKGEGPLHISFQCGGKSAEAVIAEYSNFILMELLFRCMNTAHFNMVGMTKMS